LLLALLLLVACSPDPLEGDPDTAHVFTDSTGHTVALNAPPQKVAVLFSSLAEIWVRAGGTLAVTVGESEERGIAVPGSTVLVDSGAGKSINTEVLLAAAPDFVVVSSDVPAQLEAAALLREAGIAVAELRVESFSDYLSVLKIFTDVLHTPERYAQYGTALQARVDVALQTQPFAQKKVLFIRAGSSARSVKAKSSADHFAAAMLCELGAHNIADDAPLLLDGLSMEVILANDPDYIFFVAMGDEQASRAYVDTMLKEAQWQALSAVREARCIYLSKELFHYKPCAEWATAYEVLAGFAEGAP
jgi:iron complex transport system substrate-binding protein